MKRFPELFFCLAGLLMVLVGRWQSYGSFSSLKEVHEWGTMTAVSGSNGVQFPWWRLTSFQYPENLPEFVQTNRMGGKSSFDYIQRMETPVLYFYPSGPMKVKVRVGFPGGRITEFFPSDGLIEKTRPYNFEKTDGPVTWKLNLLPPDSAEQKLIPKTGKQGSEYACAREVPEAWLVQRSLNPDELEEIGWNFRQKTRSRSDEVEKFLFYRGAADVSTPLKIFRPDENHLELVGDYEPHGNEWQLYRVSWVLKVSHGKGAWKRLGPFTLKNNRYQWTQTVEIPQPAALDGEGISNLDRVAGELRDEMQPELIKAGLSEAEARAMLKTWNDTWFKEPGTRVFYVLPQIWIDRMLPLVIEPKPGKTVRVFVARTEALSPVTEKALAGILDLLQTGADLSVLGKKCGELELGRFVTAGIQRAVNIRQAEIQNRGSQLQEEVRGPVRQYGDPAP